MTSPRETGNRMDHNEVLDHAYTSSLSQEKLNTLDDQDIATGSKEARADISKLKRSLRELQKMRHEGGQPYENLKQKIQDALENANEVYHLLKDEQRDRRVNGESLNSEDNAKHSYEVNDYGEKIYRHDLRDGQSFRMQTNDRLDGDSVIIFKELQKDKKLNLEKLAIEEDVYDPEKNEAIKDYNNDGRINSKDLESFYDDKTRENSVDVRQAYFIIGDGQSHFSISSYDADNDILVTKVENPETGKVYFDTYHNASSANWQLQNLIINEEEIDRWPEDFQKIAYINQSSESIYIEKNSAELDISQTKGFKDIMENQDLFENLYKEYSQGEMILPENQKEVYQEKLQEIYFEIHSYLFEAYNNDSIESFRENFTNDILNKLFKEKNIDGILAHDLINLITISLFEKAPEDYRNHILAPIADLLQNKLMSSYGQNKWGEKITEDTSNSRSDMEPGSSFEPYQNKLSILLLESLPVAQSNYGNISVASKKLFAEMMGSDPTDPQAFVGDGEWTNHQTNTQALDALFEIYKKIDKDITPDLIRKRDLESFISTHTDVLFTADDYKNINIKDHVAKWNKVTWKENSTSARAHPGFMKNEYVSSEIDFILRELPFFEEVPSHIFVSKILDILSRGPAETHLESGNAGIRAAFLLIVLHEEKPEILKACMQDQRFVNAMEKWVDIWKPQGEIKRFHYHDRAKEILDSYR